MPIAHSLFQGAHPTYSFLLPTLPRIHMHACSRAAGSPSRCRPDIVHCHDWQSAPVAWLDHGSAK